MIFFSKSKARTGFGLVILEWPLGFFVVNDEFDTEDEPKFNFFHQESAFFWILVWLTETFQPAK